MRWDDLPQSDNVEDRRGDGGGFGGGGGGGFPIGGGGLGIGSIIVLGLLGWALGIDPRPADQRRRNSHRRRPASGDASISKVRARRTATPTDETGKFVSARARQHRGDVEEHLRRRKARPIARRGSIIFSGATQLGLRLPRRARWGRSIARRAARSISTRRSSSDLERRFRGCSGDACKFAQAYVIAHEVGHHVQNLLGILPQGAAGAARRRRQGRRPTASRSASSCRPTASAASGRITPSSDGSCCSRATSRRRCRPRPRSATTCCSGRAQGRVVPDSFTHGSSAQRQRWFMTGFKYGTREGLQHVRGAGVVARCPVSIRPASSCR